MRNLIVSAEAVVAFAAAFLKLSSALRRRTFTAGTATLCLCLFFYGVTAILWTPLLETALPAGLPHRVRAMSVVVALFCALLTTAYVGHGIDRPRHTIVRHALTAAAILLVLLVLTAELPAPPPGQLDELDLVAACYVLAAAVELAARLLRYVAAVTRHTVVIGLWTITAATVGTGAHALNVIGTVLAMTITKMVYPCTGVVGESLLCGVRLGSAIAGPALVALGLLIPVLATACAMLRRGFRHRGLHQQLEPLWATLMAALPEIALTSATGVRGGPGPWDPNARLYRRWVEIRDGLLLLHRYRHRDWRCDTPDQEAAAIAQALRAYRTGWVVEPELRPRRQARPGEYRADEYLTDVRWLAAVADAMARHQAFRARGRESAAVL